MFTHCVETNDMDLPSTRSLQALAALKDLPSLSKAAEALGVTRSALSHRIAELERQLGVTLVRQVGRCARLTEDAESLLIVMGDALDRIEAAVTPLRRRRGQLRISTVATFASQWLIPRLPDWQRQHPDVELAISTTTRTIDLAIEDFDCAIRHGLGRWEGLTASKLFHETLLPVAHPNIASLSDASTIIRARSRFRDWNRWWRASNKTGSLPDHSMVVDNRAQAMDAVLAGAGIAMMDHAYAAPHIAAGRLRSLGATVLLPEAFYLVSPHAMTPRSATIKQFESWLAAQLRADVGGLPEAPAQ